MRTRIITVISFTSFPFSQARNNWPEYSLWDHGPTCVICQLICRPDGHLHRRSGYLHWDHGPTCIIGQLICLGPRSPASSVRLICTGTAVIAGQVICLGPRSHLSSVRLSDWDHGPCVVGQTISWDHGPTCVIGQPSAGPRSHLRHLSAYLPGTTVPPASSVRLSDWDHGPTCVVGQVLCTGTTVPPASSVSLSAWDHGPTCIVGTLLVWDNG
jgi:hypothetical protein